MTKQIIDWLRTIQTEGTRRQESCTVEGWGRKRRFIAIDFDSHTLVMEDDLLKRVEHRSPLLVVRKALLTPGAGGYVLAISSGNHSVVAMPLLLGRLWDLGAVRPERRSQALKHGVLYGHVVDSGIEISQRETPTDFVVEIDQWLQRNGLPLNAVQLADRVDETLQHYRERGQEWRIKPLAWTREEMVAAIESSQKRIHTSLRYYHNVKGVHLLTYSRFVALTRLGEEDFAHFANCLNELVGLASDSTCSLMRMEKFHGQHEIELFGVRMGVAEDRLLPELEILLCGIQSGQLSPDAALRMKREIDDTFKASLIDPGLADESSDVFVQTMYKYLTGAIYQGSPDELTPAFDDRKAALPGATYAGGRRQAHPGVDSRTLAILDYVESRIGHGERIEYINVYEIRGRSGSALGEGQTREMVYKTNRSPLPYQRIEKRLAHKSTGYGNYTLARVEAFRALGLSYGPHDLLARHDGKVGDVHYYVRDRYPGDPFTAIPRSRFLLAKPRNGIINGEKDPDVILTLSQLMGQAAAENLILKKYRQETNPNRFGIGKEIVEFGYDLQRMREMPLRTRLCSIRGTLGWPDTSRTERNLLRVFDFYMDSFARMLVLTLFRDHGDRVELIPLRDAFFEGFASKTREIFWNYSFRRETFDAFNPELDGKTDFVSQWRFALWALEEQRLRLHDLQDIFVDRVHYWSARSAASRENTAVSPDGLSEGPPA